MDNMKTTPVTLESLTDREREILGLLAEGRTTKESGLILGISPKTIEFHRMKLMKKLNLWDAVCLTHWAIAVGLVKLMFNTNITVRNVTIETTEAIPNGPIRSIPAAPPASPKVPKKKVAKPVEKLSKVAPTFANDDWMKPVCSDCGKRHSIGFPC